MRNKIYISGTNGLPGRYGGWDQLLSNLSSRMSQNYDISVHTSVKDCMYGVDEVNGAKIRIINLSANGISSIFYDFICLFDSWRNKAVCLMLGTSGGLFFPLFRILGLKIILNPDGEEWNRDKWNKGAKLFLFISDFIGLRFSNYVIADHPVIEKRAKLIRKNLKESVVYIPYGGDNARDEFLSESKDFLPSWAKEKNYFFTVCRIEPENNVHIILEACYKTKKNLIFVGNWNRSQYGRDLKRKYNIIENIKLLDPIYEPKILGGLRSNAGLYLHGHTVGGTNPSLVEAMFLGLPIICHDNIFNRYVTSEKALYFNSLESLIKSISSIDSLSINSIGINLKEHALLNYRWKDITFRYENIIKEFLL